MNIFRIILTILAVYGCTSGTEDRSLPYLVKTPTRLEVYTGDHRPQMVYIKDRLTGFCQVGSQAGRQISFILDEDCRFFKKAFKLVQAERAEAIPSEVIQ